MTPRTLTLRRWHRRITGDRRSTPPFDALPSVNKAADAKVRMMIDLKLDLDDERRTALVACSSDTFEEFVRRGGHEGSVFAEDLRRQRAEGE